MQARTDKHIAGLSAIIALWVNAARVASILMAVALVMYGACCLVLFAVQRSLLYFPPPPSPRRSDITFPLRVDGVNVLVSTGGTLGTRGIIYFGGNGEDVSQSIPLLSRAFPNDALFALHYRGYVGSGGSPSEKAIIADALILIDQVLKTHPEIVMIGRSLGSGVAVHVASLRPVTRLVLITPYDSIQELAARRFPLFPVRWLLLDKYESWRYAPQVAAPTLLIAAEYDATVPIASTKLLYEHLPKRLATLVVIPDADHNSISETSAYIPLLRGAP